jgi:hypothetical protein
VASSRGLIESAVVEALAGFGLSMGQTAKLIGKSRSAVASVARRSGVRFHGEQTRGGGCNSAQALRGWETRRRRCAP